MHSAGRTWWTMPGTVWIACSVHLAQWVYQGHWGFSRRCLPIFLFGVPLAAGRFACRACPSHLWVLLGTPCLVCPNLCSSMCSSMRASSALCNGACPAFLYFDGLRAELIGRAPPSAHWLRLRVVASSRTCRCVGFPFCALPVPVPFTHTLN